jgi:hypothetical protein
MNNGIVFTQQEKDFILRWAEQNMDYSYWDDLIELEQSFSDYDSEIKPIIESIIQKIEEN